MQEVERTGLGLIDAGHFASERIENCIDETRASWRGLLNRCSVTLQSCAYHMLVTSIWRVGTTVQLYNHKPVNIRYT